MSISAEPTPLERAFDLLKTRGNPFRQQFARNSDDPVCSRYHVSELFAEERTLLQSLVESYRGKPDLPTCVLPVLGARGAGKTHLLHCLKHGPGKAPQVYVTPGTFRIDTGGRDSSFLEYFLYQFINVLLAADPQRGARPLDYVSEHLTRRLIKQVVTRREPRQRLDLLAAGTIQRVAWSLGLGAGSVQTSINRFLDELASSDLPVRSLVKEHHFDPQKLVDATIHFLELTDARDLTGQMRKHIVAGLVRAALLNDEAALADFLTDGFVDVPFVAKPNRAQLTLSLLQTLTGVIVGGGIPVAVAFDQLEELLYGQTDDEIRRCSDAFFGGLVQLMSQVPGLCILLFVEEGLWNRIAPPLPPHILDRLQEPIHLPDSGTVRDIRLQSPTVAQLSQVVRRRVRHTLRELSGVETLPGAFPFGSEFLEHLCRNESVLRLMLQGCCTKLDEMIQTGGIPLADVDADLSKAPKPATGSSPGPVADDQSGSIDEDAPRDLPACWEHEVRQAVRKLKPVGSLSSASEELRGGLAKWLHLCKRLGVEQNDWRMSSIADHVQVGDHPTYGQVTIVEWVRESGETKKVAVGMWLGRGVGKPRDLSTKLEVFRSDPALADHLILFRPEDDVRLSGRTEQAWNNAVDQGSSLRLEPVALETFAKLYAFPRWIQQVNEVHGDGNVPKDLYLLLAGQTESIMRRLSLPSEENSLSDTESKKAA